MLKIPIFFEINLIKTILFIFLIFANVLFAGESRRTHGSPIHFRTLKAFEQCENGENGDNVTLHFSLKNVPKIKRRHVGAYCIRPMAERLAEKPNCSGKTKVFAINWGLKLPITGNMIYQEHTENDLIKNISYDSENRITKVTDGGENTVGEYFYDDYGFRVRKIGHLSPKSPLLKDEKGLSRYQNASVDLIYPSMYYGMERIINKNHKVIANTHSAVNNIYLNGIRIAALGDKGDLQYYLTDQVDSVKLVLNGDGEVVNKFEYLPYGESWITEGDGLNAPKYNSQELDRETSFYFYNARYYDPEIARFVTADTVIDGELSSVGWNRYAYVKGNPVRYKDPTGHYLCGTGKSESCLEAYEPETTKRSITLEQAKENLESRKFVLNNLDNSGVGIGMALTGPGKSSEQYEASAKKGAALWNVFAGFSGAVAKSISKLTNLNKKGNNTVKNVTQGTTGGGTVTPVKVNNVKSKSTDTGRFGSLKNNESNKTYEILEGVRRSKISYDLNNKKMEAEVYDKSGSKFIRNEDISIDSLYSGLKLKINIKDSKSNKRYFDLQKSIEKDGVLERIRVTEGKGGIKIEDIDFDY
jgi:RHS repeat-associated protein